MTVFVRFVPGGELIGGGGGDDAGGVGGGQQAHGAKTAAIPVSERRATARGRREGAEQAGQPGQRDGTECGEHASAAVIVTCHGERAGVVSGT